MRSAFSIAVISSVKRLVDGMEDDLPWSAEEREAFDSDDLNNMLDNFNSDPIVVDRAVVSVTGGEEVKSCLPAHVAVPLAVVERIDCVAETALLLRLLGGESASALVVGYSELARDVYTYVVERRIVLFVLLVST